MGLRFKFNCMLPLFLMAFALATSAQSITPEMLRKARQMGVSQAQIDAAMGASSSSLPGSNTSAGDRADTESVRSGTDAAHSGVQDTSVVRRLELLRQLQQLESRRDSNLVFGKEIFSNKNLTFAPSYNIATPPSYVLGPGDEVVIEVWGAAESRMKHRVSPEGTVSIQGLGPVNVGGLTVADAQVRIQAALGEIMSGQVKVSLGEIRSIKVNISGEVAVPGTYTLPSLATVFNAIYLAGGVNDIGSLRSIRVYRNNEPVAELDVYDYLIDGKYEANIRLEDNDMIIVPPYDNYVKVSGKVKRGCIYELKKDETLGKLIEYTGGFTGDAYTDNLTVRRKSGRRLNILTVEADDMDSFVMSDGDEVQVGKVLPVYANLVAIEGAVWRPGEYELSEKTSSLSRLIARAEGLKGSEFASRGQIARLDTVTLIYSVIPFNVRDVAEGREDIALMNRDRVYIPNIYDLHEEYTVDVSGEVNSPQTLEFREGMTVEDAILLCGGLRESASLAKIEVARRIKNPDATDYTANRAETFSFQIAEDLAIAPAGSRFVLEPFDEIYIRRSPGYSEQQRVMISGEILFPGEYVISTAGERLSDLIRKSGGFSPEAYVQGASVQRRLSDDERAKVISALNIAEDSKGADSLSIESVEIPEYYPVGVDVVEAVKNPGGNEDIVLQEGDRVLVPKYNSTVRISGAVLHQNSVVYGSRRVKDYIYQAGGYMQNARKRPFIVYMNGKVASTRNGFLCKRYPKVEPGCHVIVPMKKERKEGGLANVMGMMSSTASLAAMVASIINLSK